MCVNDHNHQHTRCRFRFRGGFNGARIYGTRAPNDRERTPKARRKVGNSISGPIAPHRITYGLHTEPRVHVSSRDTHGVGVIIYYSLNARRECVAPNARARLETMMVFYAYTISGSLTSSQPLAIGGILKMVLFRIVYSMILFVHMSKHTQTRTNIVQQLSRMHSGIYVYILSG